MVKREREKKHAFNLCDLRLKERSSRKALLEVSRFSGVLKRKRKAIKETLYVTSTNSSRTKCVLVYEEEKIGREREREKSI